MPDEKDYVDSSDDGIAEDQNDHKIKKCSHRVMEKKSASEMMDVQGSDEPTEDHNNMELMEDDNISIRQTNNESSVKQNKEGNTLLTAGVKKKYFEPKIKVSRKRQRNPSEWKKNKAALCRQRGEAYRNYKGQLKPAKTSVTGNLCPENCRRQCSQSFTIEDRKIIMSSFYKLDINAKNSLLYNSLKITPTKRQRTGALQHKTASFQYNITYGGKQTAVCKRAFVSIYNISMKKVDLIQQSIKKGLAAPLPDKRGKHNNRPNKTPEDVTAYIIKHISSFPSESSHYSRNCNIHKKYLSPLLSLPIMHKLYIETCNANKVPNRFKVKECTYRYIFNNEFNLSFGHPKSDTCSTCDSGTGNEGHTENYKAAFAAQVVDRELAKNSDGVAYITFDLQQTMPLPRLSTSKAFYLRQMWFYNLGIHIITKEVDKTVFCTWTEDLACRGSSEISSCLLRTIEVELALKQKNHLIIWTDSCAGQNKNFLMLCIYQYLIQKNIFKIIDHKFPEVGHSYLDSDRDFGRIEKILRKHQTICTPQQYREIIASSNKKSMVIDMEHHFRDTEDLPQKMKLMNRKKDVLNEKVYFRDGIKWIRVDTYGSYLFKESFDYYTPFKEVNIHKNLKNPSSLPENFDIPRSFRKTGVLSKEKRENLKEQLCFIPDQHKWFYEHVLHEEHEGI